MNVAIDTCPLHTARAGVARYVRELTAAIPIVAPSVNITSVAWEVDNFGYRQPARAIKTGFRELIWGPLVAPARLRQLRPDIVHHTHARMIRVPAGRTREVLTIHDLAAVRFPRRYRAWQRALANHILARTHGAHRIICISRFTADEAMELLSLPASRIEVVPNGGAVAAPPMDVALPPGTPDEFFLFIGSLEPGKNLALLLDAYRHAESNQIALPPLIVVGTRWQGVGETLSPPASWLFLGHQTDDVTFTLLGRARALLFPTRYEGFGLPIVESQSLCTPVICSPVASLPEVAGDAVLFADPTPREYVTAMKRILSDEALRHELIERGLINARRFTWDRCAAETVEVYRESTR